MEEALFLTRFATHVTVVHRRDQLRASKIMQERAFKHEKISFMWDTVIEDVLGEPGPGGGVQGVKVRNVKTDEVREVKTAGLFVTIGHIPNTALFSGQLTLDPRAISSRHPVRPTRMLRVCLPLAMSLTTCIARPSPLLGVAVWRLSTLSAGWRRGKAASNAAY